MVRVRKLLPKQCCIQQLRQSFRKNIPDMHSIEMYGVILTTLNRGKMILYLQASLSHLDPRVEWKRKISQKITTHPPPSHFIWFRWLICQEHYGHKADETETQVESYCMHSDGPYIQIPVGSCPQIIPFLMVTQIQRASHLWRQLEPQETLSKRWGKQQQQYSKRFMK